MSLQEAEKLALNCLKQSMEETITENNVELVVITTANPQFTERTTA